MGSVGDSFQFTVGKFSVRKGAKVMTQDEKDKVVSDTLDKVLPEAFRWWMEELNRRCELVNSIYNIKPPNSKLETK